MAIEIRQVRTRAQLKAFIKFPLSIYGKDPNYVPAFVFDDLNTLRKDKNAAFEFCEAEYWTAWKDGKMAGRIAGIINHRYIEKWGHKYARFGWIDFIKDFEVAKALVETVEDWARSKGMEGVHGPLGFTDLDREGMLVQGFGERATFATIYNYPYYPEYLEKLGYAKDVDWIEFQVRAPKEIPEKVQRVNEILSNRTGYRIDEWTNKKELISKYGSQIFDLIDEAYADLYGTVPLSKKQVQSYIDQYLGWVDPRFTKILVDAEGKLAGFAISVPSLSEPLYKCKGSLFPFGWVGLLRALKNPKTIDMLLVAVRKECVSKGVIALLMNALNKSVVESGVEFAETNPELETNTAVHGIWKDYPKRQHKRRRVYLKTL
ncbi:MAG: N-acetyltransferase [Spirochaetaceae bacterium]|nr:N-acetyltransferase [Spirochaetaceae bacterium]